MIRLEHLQTNDCRLKSRGGGIANEARAPGIAGRAIQRCFGGNGNRGAGTGEPCRKQRIGGIRFEDIKLDRTRFNPDGTLESGKGYPFSTTFNPITGRIGYTWDIVLRVE